MNIVPSFSPLDSPILSGTVKNILKIHLSCSFDTVTVGKNSKFLFLRYSDVYQTHTPPPPLLQTYSDTESERKRDRQTDRQTNRLKQRETGRHTD